MSIEFRVCTVHLCLLNLHHRTHITLATTQLLRKIEKACTQLLRLTTCSMLLAYGHAW